MLQPKYAIGLLATFIIGLAANPASSQDIFGGIADQIRGRVEQEINRGLPNLGPPQRGNPPQPGTPQYGTRSAIPSEGGQQNIDNRFRDNGFFQPQPQPQPQPRFQPIPSQTFPQSSQYTPQPQPYRVQSVPQSTVTQTYPEPVNRVSTTRNGLPIKIRCGESIAQSVNYKLLLSGQAFPYTMRQKESQAFDDTRLWLISFVRGNKEITYRLVGGNMYTFDFDSTGELQLFKELSIDGVVIPEPPKRDAM